MIKIAICDDEKIVLDKICSKVQNAFSEINCTTEIFKTHKPFDLVEHIKNSTTDVLFLDIDMPTYSGDSALGIIRARETDLSGFPSRKQFLYLISDKKWTKICEDIFRKTRRSDAARLSPCKDDNVVLRKIDRKDCLFFI